MAQKNKPQIELIDVTGVVANILDKAGYGDDSNDATDIKEAGMFDVLDALSGKDNSKFSVEQAKEEMQRRGL